MSVRSHFRCGLLAAAGWLAMTSMAGAQVVSQVNPGPTYSFYPTAGTTIPRVFSPGVAPAADRPTHPPIDQVSALPKPAPAFHH